MFKKNICYGVGGQDKLNGIALYPRLFWLDNIFKGKIIFCGAVSVDQYLQSPSPVPVEVDNLVFQGKLKGDPTA